jgi:hypothetical protein
MTAAFPLRNLRIRPDSLFSLDEFHESTYVYKNCFRREARRLAGLHLGCPLLGRIFLGNA